MIRITPNAFDPEIQLARFRQEHGAAGAIASFIGIVRNDGQTEALTLSHYPGFTEPQIQDYIRQATARWDLHGAKVVHRVGRMIPGDPVVFVATASAHRRAAFEACDHLMDRLKADAPFWKSETRKGRTEWVEPRAQDRDDLARWD